MQIKFHRTKAFQFNKWYNEIVRLKTFGSKENIKLFEEWNRFHITSTLIKTKNYKQAIKNILKYPFNRNKFKLLIMLTLPEIISKNIVGET